MPEAPKDSIADRSDRILITGSNGFIGARVAESLLGMGFSNLCCFVRPSSKLDRLKEICARFNAERSVQIVAGDLMSREDCEKAADGVAITYHLAAGFDKSFAGSFMSTALATRNLMDALLKRGKPKRFVNVSTFAVYSNLHLGRGAVLDETCPLEDAPTERNDAYCFGKLKQEELVREYAAKHGLKYVTLRPGTVYGPGKSALSGRVGIDTFGVFIQIGGNNFIPLTYVDNCADAIVLSGLKSGVDGQAFNIVDDTPMTGREFLSRYKRSVRSFRSIRIPYAAAYAGCWLWEKYSRWSEGQLPAVFNRRRCSAEWKRNRYSNLKIREALGWRPRISLDEAFAAMAAAAKSAET